LKWPYTGTLQSIEIPHVTVRYGTDNRKVLDDDNALTLLSGGKTKGGRQGGASHRAPVVASQIRRLTPTECERLQGFPDGWTEGVSDTQRYKCLGNAVTVNVIMEIASKLLAA